MRNALALLAVLIPGSAWARSPDPRAHGPVEWVFVGLAILFALGSVANFRERKGKEVVAFAVAAVAMIGVALAIH